MHIPENHYVGIISREGDMYPLGFMTEDGTDASSTKRKATVDQWTGRNNSSYTCSVKNEVLSGFILTDGIFERHRSGVRTKWRIEDPRGFELEISWHNLEYIMKNTVIDSGEILADCIWGREKGDNYLLVKGTPEYDNSIEYLGKPKKTISLKDLKLGDNVLFKNGETGVFLGKHQGTLCFNKNDYLYEVKKPTIIDHLGNKELSEKDAEHFILENTGFYSKEIYPSGIKDTKEEIIEYNFGGDSFYGDIYSEYNGVAVTHHGNVYNNTITIYYNDTVLSHSWSRYRTYRSNTVPVNSLGKSYYKKTTVTTNLDNQRVIKSSLTREEFLQFKNLTQ